MTDCEVIIVDDGLTDYSLSVCKEYFGINEAGPACKIIKNSVNIIICSKKNDRVSSARNWGIELTSNEYILFVTPNYLIKKNYVDALDKVINNEIDIDIIYFGFDKVTYTQPGEE